MRSQYEDRGIAMIMIAKGEWGDVVLGGEKGIQTTTNNNHGSLVVHIKQPHNRKNGIRDCDNRVCW